MKSLLLFQMILVLMCFPTSAHENHSHEKPKEKDLGVVKENYDEINKNYVSSVKPIFEKKCFDCHSQHSNLPWYSKVPFAKGLIHSDVTEAKKHLDMTGDFPFKGHGSPEEDLQAIKGSVEKSTMPPKRYKIMHWNSGINSTEAAKIYDWVNSSLKILEKKN